jgi:uncharacterized protein
MFLALTDLLLYDLAALDPAYRWNQVLHFFLYDTLKISVLLISVIILMGVVNSYLPVDKIKLFLERKKLFGLEHLLASLLGAVTPFCSCSSIPIFIGFLKGGIPLGVTLSFLITSPLVNEIAVVLFIGIFGVKVTIYYVVAGILTGSIVGLVLGKLGLERYLAEWVQEQLKEKIALAQVEDNRTLSQRLPEIRDEALDIFHRVLPYVIGGIAIGALIHGLVPSEQIEPYMSRDNIWAIPASTLFAIPIYSSASGVVPVIQTLVSKGVPIGTALAFMMGVVGLSFPEAVLLKKVMQAKLIAIYFGAVATAIMAIGYLFNLLI